MGVTLLLEKIQWGVKVAFILKLWPYFLLFQTIIIMWFFFPCFRPETVAVLMTIIKNIVCHSRPSRFQREQNPAKCQTQFQNKLTESSKINAFLKGCIYTGKNNGFPFLDILGYLKNTHKNPKFGKVRQVPTREFPTKFPDWDLSHSSKFRIFVGIL